MSGNTKKDCSVCRRTWVYCACGKEHWDKARKKAKATKGIEWWTGELVSVCVYRNARLIVADTQREGVSRYLVEVFIDGGPDITLTEVRHYPTADEAEVGALELAFWLMSYRMRVRRRQQFI